MIIGDKEFVKDGDSFIEKEKLDGLKGPESKRAIEGQKD